MIQEEPLDLIVQIGRGGAGEYPVAVYQGAARSAQAIMRLRLDDPNLQALLDALQQAWSRLASGADPERGTQPGSQLGTVLFESLFAGEIASFYVATCRQAARLGQDLSLKLQIRSPDLLCLPWELLHDPNSGQYLAVTPGNRLVRYVDRPRSAWPKGPDLPLRMLWLTLHDGDHTLEQPYSSLPVEGPIELTWRTAQTWDDLQHAVQQGRWHAVVLSGQASIDAGTGEDSLLLTTRTGQVDRLGATRLGWLLSHHQGLQFAWLHPLPSTPNSGYAALIRMADELVQRGVPGTFTQQGPMAQPLQEATTRDLFAALLTGDPLDLALSRARQAVVTRNPEYPIWAQLVLCCHTPRLRLGLPDLGAENRPTTQDRPAPAPGPRMATDLATAREALASLSTAIEPDADDLLALLATLQALQQQRPTDPEVHRMWARLQLLAKGTRDSLWQQGRARLGGKALGLTLSRRLRRAQEGLQLLDKAAKLDPEQLVELSDEQTKARYRIDYLQKAVTKGKTGRHLLAYGALTIVSIIALALFVLAAGRRPRPAFLSRTALTATVQLTTSLPETPTSSLDTETPAAQSLASSPETEARAQRSPSPAPSATLTPWTQVATARPSPTSSPVSSPSHTPQGPSVTPSPPPLPTETASPPLPSTALPIVPTALPTVSPPNTPTPTPTYVPPNLLQPQDTAFLSQGGLSIYTLRWEWAGTLAENQWFDVRIWRRGQLHYGVAWTKERAYAFDICLLGSGDYFWSIAIVQGHEGQWQADLSPESVPHRFTTSRYDNWCQRHGRYIMPLPSDEE